MTVVDCDMTVVDCDMIVVDCCMTMADATDSYMTVPDATNSFHPNETTASSHQLVLPSPDAQKHSPPSPHSTPHKMSPPACPSSSRCDGTRERPCGRSSRRDSAPHTSFPAQTPRSNPPPASRSSSPAPCGCSFPTPSSHRPLSPTRRSGSWRRLAITSPPLSTANSTRSHTREISDSPATHRTTGNSSAPPGERRKDVTTPREPFTSPRSTSRFFNSITCAPHFRRSWEGALQLRESCSMPPGDPVWDPRGKPTRVLCVEDHWW